MWKRSIVCQASPHRSAMSSSMSPGVFIHECVIRIAGSIITTNNAFRTCNTFRFTCRVTHGIAIDIPLMCWWRCTPWTCRWWAYRYRRIWKLPVTWYHVTVSITPKWRTTLGRNRHTGILLNPSCALTGKSKVWGIKIRSLAGPEVKKYKSSREY